MLGGVAVLFCSTSCAGVATCERFKVVSFVYPVILTGRGVVWGVLLQSVATTLSTEHYLPLMMYGRWKDHMDHVLILGHCHDDFLQLLIQGGFLFCLPVYYNALCGSSGVFVRLCCNSLHLGDGHTHKEF